MAGNKPNKKPKNRIFREYTERTVDPGTGEILSENKTFVSVYSEREPPFVKTYFHENWHSKLVKLSATSFLVLLSLANAMDYENRVRVGETDVETMATKFGLKKASIRKCMTEMVKFGVLVRQKRGDYVVSPEIMAKGRWEEIREIRRVLDFVEANNRMEEK